MPRVNPDILRWAREQAGFELAEAAAKLAIRPTKTASAEERLIALETGEEQASRAMLLKMAKRYRRPLVLFYLDAPPRIADRGTDFRMLPQAMVRESEPLLDALIRDVKARQSLVRSILIDEDEAERLPFVGSMTVADGMERVAASIRDTLDLDLDELRGMRNPDEAFDLLRGRVEAIGVFVLLVGDLGSYHTALDRAVFRGFAIADDVAPFIVVNRNDARAALLFTVIHELAHVWLGQTGISGGALDHDVEAFCNRVASLVLLPDDDYRAIVDRPVTDLAALQAAIGRYAAARNVSSSMVAYRLFQDRLIDEATWRRLDAGFASLWAEAREEARARAREREGGPDFYVVKRFNLGDSLVRLTARMMQTGALSTSKAGIVLGVKPKQVGRLLAT